jgi:hypothetical protein
MCICLHVKYLLLFSDFIKLNFVDRFSKNTEILSFLIIRPVGAELFHAGGRADGRTDRQTDRQTDIKT